MFVKHCVGLVISFFVWCATFVISSILTMDWDKDETMCVACCLASVGFGVCVTVLLYQNGVI